MCWRAKVEALCLLHGPRLRHLARRIVRDEGAAQDICQEAFARACARPVEVENRNASAAWLTRIVLNISLDELRRRRAMRNSTEALARRAEALEPIGIAEDERELLLEALMNLPDEMRVVVALRIMQDVSGNEVAQMLNCSAAEVSRLLYSGMELLRSRLRPSAEATSR